MDSIINSPLIETLLCLVLVYALLSLIVSNITEVLNSYFKERSKLLYKSISALFNDEINVNFGQLLYNHPTIDKLKKDKCNPPQYISAEMFSNGIIDVIGNYSREYSFNQKKGAITMDKDTRDIFERFEDGVNKMHHTDLKLFLLNLVDKSTALTEKANAIDTKTEALQKMLQSWYNDHMQRVTGWYKDKIRNRLFWIALFCSIVINVDSIHLFQYLYRNPALRAQLKPIAENLAANYSKLQQDTTLSDMERAYKAAALTRIVKDTSRSDSSTKALTQLLTQFNRMDTLLKLNDSSRKAMIDRTTSEIDQVNSLGLPIGWQRDAPPLSWSRKINPDAKGYFEKYKNGTGWNIFSYLLGILISAFALSIGAPFWFTLLVKFVNIRRAGTKPESSK